MKNNITDIRKDYTQAQLQENDAAPDPFVQFQTWLDAALATQQPEPNAMHLATVNTQGAPSGRIVLLRSITPQGFCFFTNYESRKALHIQHNAQVCATFFWANMERQIRIEGTVLPLPHPDSDAYYHSRPRSSQIGAWASPQSSTIPNRAFLEQLFIDFEQKFADQTQIPRPVYWGGYCIVPHYIEFWQGRASRLHDRIIYQKDATNNAWQISRLAP
jgi:pyridoxamine 5'-phosphate oxidase